MEYAASGEQFRKTNGILIGRAVKSLEDGNIIGSLIIRTNERFFSNIYKNIDIGEDSDIFVLDSQGTVVSSRNPEMPVSKPYDDRLLLQKIIEDSEKDSRVFRYSIDGEEHLVAFAPMRNADWFVVSTIPFSYLHSESNKIKVNTLLLGVICFMLAVLLSYVFSTGISKPLKKLVRAMNEARTGNLSVNVAVAGKDEIGEVTSNFNIMLNEIRNLLESVKNKEKQKREAELKALQAQISPHFLSNTLNTVKWLANVQKADNIENIITSLIQLLHISIGKGEDMISIREEIEYVKNYVNIQKYRYYNKFKVNFEIEEDILDCRIPKLLLQPVVENSLIHGIAPMEGQGFIVVKGYRYEDKIILTVTDNGVGISQDKIKNLMNFSDLNNKSHFSGIGIENVRQRIRTYFGEQYGLNIQSVPYLYTTTEITLPVVEKEGVGIYDKGINSG